MYKHDLNKLIKKYVFNKSMHKTIIFIHGLFGNSGFWLPFLANFNEYKILILDIDYPKLFEKNLNKITYQNFFSSILDDDEDFTLISHSIGTVFTNYFPHKKINISYEICPIKNSVKNNKKKFVQEINSLTKFSKKEIEYVLNQSSIFLSNNFILNDKSLIKMKFIPKEDLFFDNLYGDNVKYFEGNHFNINDSILMIKDHLVKY